MSYRGDFTLGSTFDLKFTTIDAGIPTQLAGSPVISAYPDNSTTQLTAGITLTVDFDSVTGLNNVRVVATSGNGYAAGSNYDLVVTTGTVGGKSLVGYVIGSFSIEARHSASAAAVWAYVIETGYTALQLFRLASAALAGKLSGGGTTTVIIRDVTDSKDRITATVDGDGNRTAITYDVS